MSHYKNERAPSDVIELFVQVEGKQQITIVRVPSTASVQDLIDEALRLGLLDVRHRAQLLAFLEDVESELRLEERLSNVGVKHRSRVHFHRCHHIGVIVHFNADSKEHSFRPSASIAKVFEWAVSSRGFNLTPTDAVEHVLQITGSSTRPDEDVHIGALTQAPDCALSFDLVAKRRVEG